MYFFFLFLFSFSKDINTWALTELSSGVTKTGYFGSISAKLHAIRRTSALNKFNKGIRWQPQSSPALAEQETWKVGLRTVELQTLADQLDCANVCVHVP